jgi:hypothetical protein
MTQILSLVTPSHVFQISDRRTSTRLSNGRVEAQPYEENKAVLWGRRVAFAYSGLARIRHEYTDCWLTRVLAAANTDSLPTACEAVRSAATKAFQGMYIPANDKRTLFTAVGWTNAENRWRPIAIEISNFKDRNGEVLDCALAVFQTRWWISPTPGSILGWSSPPPRRERVQLERAIRRVLQHRPTLPGAVRCLAKAVRQTAAANPKTIGTELMAVHIPIPRTPPDFPFRKSAFGYISGAFSEQGPSFCYLPTVGTPKFFGPNVVEGGTATANFECGAL